MTANTEDPLLGTPVLGGYLITGILGAGGMGSVYLAEHQRLAKKVAVKVLHPHMTSNRDIVERFLAEARAASALDHPNIIEVLDAATLPDGRDYIALEFLDGDALDDYIKVRSVLDLSTALHILAETCCGLEAAHHRGIVHRDLKPANLFVTKTDLDPLRVKVLDFGIAKLTDTVMAGDIKTGTNAVAGTPGYMAPEQARGMRDVDHRADIYALGAVAYRMMSGAMPYVGSSLGEIIYQQMSAPPANILDHRPDLPAGWVQAIMSSLGGDPNMRPPSARHFALEIARATPGGMELIRKYSPLLFSDIWIERNRELVSRLPQVEPAVPAAAGGTATYLPTEHPSEAAPMAFGQHAVPAASSTIPQRQAVMMHAVDSTPATTLSSSVGNIYEPRPASMRPKRWLLIGGAAAATAAAAAIAIATVGGGAEPIATSDPTDAGISLRAFDASVLAKPSATIDAAPARPDAAPAKPVKLVELRVKTKPSRALIELNGATARSPLKLRVGSEHKLTVSYPGFVSESRQIVVKRGKTERFSLSKRRGAAKKPGDDQKSGNDSGSVADSTADKTAGSTKTDPKAGPKTNKDPDLTPKGPISTTVD